MDITKENLIDLGFREEKDKETSVFFKQYMPYGGREDNLYLFWIGRNLGDEFFAAGLLDEEGNNGTTIKRVDSIEDIQTLYYALSGDSLTNKI